jgi:UDP-N-acetylmuramoyl-tripeptide--D-alanyl-D-alanine ligase
MLTLVEAQAAIEDGGMPCRREGPAGLRFASVSTDTRSLQPGALYVALRGPRFDGHAFAPAARARGAAALLVEEPMAVDLPQLIVADPRRALGLLAAHWRARFTLPVIAVTGSNGKTTTTQMIASILAHAFGDRDGQAAWFATRGNRNNDIGVPQMLLELGVQHRAAVFELGMNHPGEIALLSDWVRPTVALVTNAQREHQEFMASVEATARENGQSIAALAPDGCAVFPADDDCAGIWRALAGTRRVVDFALRAPAAVQGGFRLDEQRSALQLRTPAGEIGVELALGGEHNVRNALAACAACLAVGIGLEDIAAGLATFRPVPGRGTRLSGHGAVNVIDDSYNANPDSVRASVDLLARQAGPRILVFGDMGEVGARAADFHREIGAYARERGIDRLLALGTEARAAVAAFGPGATHYDTIDELNAACLALAQADADSRGAAAPATFLVKGSRFMRLERVVAALGQAEPAPQAGAAGEPGTHA